MPEREGTPYARALFASTTVKEWESYVGLYSTALQKISAKRKKPELLEDDSFLFTRLPTLAYSGRQHAHLKLDEIVTIMRWKLNRGTFRPLLKLAGSNPPQYVQQTTQQALTSLSQDKWKEAFASVMQLSGFGVATASAVLCIFRPDLCPFMADEVLESTTDCGRNYTMAAYCKMREALIRKADALGPEWTAEKVGKALWTAAALGEDGPLATASSNNSTMTSKAPTPATTSSRKSSVSKKEPVQESSTGEDAPKRKRKRTA